LLRLKLLPELKHVLAYKNNALISYFCHHHKDVGTKEATQLFEDLLAWLWLNAYRKTKAQDTYLFGPLLKLDDLWHAFILHTRAYHTFCNDYFGEYFHHEIEPVNSEHIVSADELADFLSDAIDNLGVPWVTRYFALQE
jgi:hypothetical protein